MPAFTFGTLFAGFAAAAFFTVTESVEHF
jgi:hypothetical protein